MEMRRKDRQLTFEETKEIMTNAEYGVLSTVDDEGMPYGVPMSFAYSDGVIYMHGTNAGGHKHSNIVSSGKASFTVIDGVELMPEKFGTKYLSAIAFGDIEIISDESEKQKGIEAILHKYSPDFIESGMKYIEGAFSKFEIMKLTVTKLSGKGRKK